MTFNDIKLETINSRNNSNSKNHIEIYGKIVSDLEFSHETHDIKYYRFYVEVNRLSKAVDTLPVIVSEKLLECGLPVMENDENIHIVGQIRMFHTQQNGVDLFTTFVYAYSLEIVSEKDVAGITANNEAELTGKILTSPAIKISRAKQKHITYFIMQVENDRGKKNNIHCICWNEMADKVKKLEKGTKISIKGRFQSRVHKNIVRNEMTIEDVEKVCRMGVRGVINDGNLLWFERDVYEVSISELEVIEKGEEENVRN